MERFHKIWIQFGPIVAFGSLLALLWMMRHITQGPAAFHGVSSSPPCFAVMLIAGTIPFGSWMQDLLVFKPLAALGHYSYGIYLWHWPLWLLLRSLLPQWGAWHADRLLSFTFILTVLFAFASWRLFEKPVARAGFHRVDSSDQWRRSRALRPSDIHGRGAGMLMELLRIHAVATASGTNQCGAIAQVSAPGCCSNAIMPLWNDAEHRCQRSHGIRCRMVRKWPPSEFGDAGVQQRIARHVPQHHCGCRSLTVDGEGTGSCRSIESAKEICAPGSWWDLPPTPW